MPTLIDAAGNRHDYTTLVEHQDSVQLDGGRFIAGRLSDFTLETASPTELSVLDFLALFTVREEARIKKSTDEVVSVFYGRLTNSRRETVRLAHPDTIDGVRYCESLLDGDTPEARAARAERILAGSPPD